MEPSLSADCEPSKLTVSGAVPLVGVAVAAAMGALLAVTTGAMTTMGVLAELVSPCVSVTVSVAV